MMYFLVWFVIPGVKDMWSYFTAHLISRMVQTFLFSIPFYFINHFIYLRLNTEMG